MISHLRLWRQFWITAFVREAAFRANFFVSAFSALTQVALALITFALIFQFVPSIAAWTQAQVLLVVGIYRIVDGIVSAQIAPNMRAIDGYVEKGDLDLLLMRPVASQLLISTRLVQLPELINIPIGLALVAYAGAQAGVVWSITGIGAAAVFLLCGIVVLYALWFMLMTLAVWLTWSPFEGIFYSLFDTARYPVDFFPGGVRALLTFVVPAAFATTFPAEALLGRADPRMLPVGLALAAGALLASHLFWNYALRRYSSASS